MKEEEESKLEDEIIVTNILPLLIQYMESKSFHKEIIDFLDEFSGNFDDIAESKQPEQEVQKLEFTDIFYKYQELLNQLIDGFARKHDTSIHIVFENCRDAGLFFIIFFYSMILNYKFTFSGREIYAIV